MYWGKPHWNPAPTLPRPSYLPYFTMYWGKPHWNWPHGDWTFCQFILPCIGGNLTETQMSDRSPLHRHDFTMYWGKPHWNRDLRFSTSCIVLFYHVLGETSLKLITFNHWIEVKAFYHVLGETSLKQNPNLCICENFQYFTMYWGKPHWNLQTDQ